MVGDQKLTMELWRGNVFEPSYSKSLPNDIKTAPDVNVFPEFVFGYKSRETRNNLKYLDDNTIAYHAGSIVIVHDLLNNSQKHFLKHKEEIQGFSISKNKKYIAAHDVIKSKSTNKPILVVWDYEKKEEILIIENINSKGVSSIAFDSDGEFLVCLGADDDRTISLVCINDKNIKFSDKTGKSRILDACFKDKNVNFKG
jgi:microtubule-associated protein-like 1/2